MGWRSAVTSEYRAITTERSLSATFESGSSHEQCPRAALDDDVPPVLHLGGLVRHHGNVSRTNTALHRPADRFGLWCDGDRRPRVAVLHGRSCRPLFLEREAVGAPASDRGRRDVARLDANVIRDFLPAPHSLRAVLHAYAFPHQFHLVSPRARSGPRL